MPLTFSDEDFSQHKFSDEDFSPASAEAPEPTQLEQPSLIGRSKDELADIAAKLRRERVLGNALEIAATAGTGLHYAPGRRLAGEVLGIPESFQPGKPLVDPETLRQTVEPITTSMGLTDPITQAALEVGAETGSALTTPEALQTAATGPAAPAIFGAEMIKGSPQVIPAVQEAAKTGDLKETAKAVLSGAVQLAAPLGIAAEAGRRATPQIERTPDASSIEKATEVHGDVLQRPGESPGQVPIEKSGARIQPQAEGRIQEKVGGEKIAQDQDLKWGGELRGLWQFDIKDPNGEIRFTTKAGATPEEVADKAKTKLEEFYGAADKTEEATPAPADVAKMSIEEFDQFAGKNATGKAYEAARNIGVDGDRTVLEEGQKSVADDLSKLMEDMQAAKTPEEQADVFNKLQKLNGKKQYFSEALRMLKAMDDVYKGESIADAAKTHGVAEERLKENTKSAPEPVLESKATPHGLPAGVPDRGPQFASELLEASRQLGALVRSRATLRPGVLGQFVRTRLAGIKQADKIEVGDIRNQKTVAHEIGHSLDGILWPTINFGESQKSLAARANRTYPSRSQQDLARTGKELTKELTDISILMRGPMTGSAGHIAYRKRATELIADYFSLYLHDPDRARAMAPKWSKAFEADMAKDVNTDTLVKQVLAGDVTPRPPDPALKKQLAGITGTAPQPGTAIPGAVPAPQKLAPPARERVAAVASEGLVKDAVRTFEAKVQKARIVADDWRKKVPNQVDRNDVGAFVEGIGNLEKPGDTIDRVRTRMTPAKERLAKDYRFRTELERQDINQYLKDTEEGEYLKFLEDYLGHFYVDPLAKRQAAVSRFAKESPHAKQRKLPTLKEAVDMGLTPITQDPANTYELTSRINWRVATNRKFVGELKNITTGSGEPVILPAKDAPPGWEITSNPLIQRVYARQTPNGTMIWRGGAAVHPDIWRSARQLLENPTAGTLGQAYDAINGFTRANAFAFSMFHDLTLRSAAIGSMAGAKNPLRGLFRIMERNPQTGELELFRSTRGLGKELLQSEDAVTDAAQHGLKFSYTDSEAYQHNARTFLEKVAAKWRDVPVLGTTSRLARDLQQWRQKGLWQNTHDAFKIVTYNDMVNKALEKAPQGTDMAPVKEKIASLLNDAYGGQEWQTKFWLDPGTRKVLSRFFLAPDWTLSTLRSVPGLSDIATTAREQGRRLAGRQPFDAQLEGTVGNVKRARFWGAEIAGLAMATAAAQYAIYQTFGDKNKGDQPYIWNNEVNQKGRIDVTPLMRKFPWHDPKDPSRYYVNLGKRPAEVVNWVTELDKQIMSKASRPVAIVFEQLSGSEGDFKADWKQDHESFLESLPARAKAIGTEALPFTFRGNQFALSAPVRKGMTKYKAEQAYESVFELLANPNRLRSMLRGQASSEGTVPEMTSQITDAAKRNGVNTTEVLKRSLSTVRGHHYNEFFKAFDSDDQKKMNEEADALVRLGATTRGISESIRRRIELQSVPQ